MRLNLGRGCGRLAFVQANATISQSEPRLSEPFSLSSGSHRRMITTGGDKAVVRTNDDDIETLVNKSLGSATPAAAEVQS